MAESVILIFITTTTATATVPLAFVAHLNWWYWVIIPKHQPRAQRILRPNLAKRPVKGRKKKGRTKPSSWPGFGAFGQISLEACGGWKLDQGQQQVGTQLTPNWPTVGEGKGEGKAKPNLGSK
ncbi:hypothetical protein TIFTF001_029365 [Ficus carica]|uniref:Uncharacterized protein n=1 Tax=Ficus carica TaxID=3494 RepID=A0AA88DRS7_FICCA|nr:hypothetical protein TIFTF001_029365 [Ficus carica]